MLIKAFGYNITREILSMAWYLACECDALVNSNVWPGHFETRLAIQLAARILQGSWIV